MIHYTETYFALKSLLKAGNQVQHIPGSDACFQSFEFTSDTPGNVFPATRTELKGLSNINSDDSLIAENVRFTYPVIIPASDKGNRAIILLHGLNERSWVKYYPWAERLARELRRPVILFPISFHMNRSPAEWSNPRLMSPLLPSTRLRNRQNRSSTFVNLALSLRLSQQPLRFFTSGRQSALDLEKLISSIQSGNHPLFAKGTGIDFFAYSIGAFLAQIMMLAYGETFLNDTRLMMFCGGAPFNRMNGVSKLIMDEEAFSRLRFFYLRQFEKELSKTDNPFSLFRESPATKAFNAMVDSRRLREWRNHRFEKMRKRISTIALKKDEVIPPSGISEIMNTENLRIMDFPFEYTHENPFPLMPASEKVDHCFEKVFAEAAIFLR
jgi:pimeloyl-ACP methyl ester carboxylesterase